MKRIIFSVLIVFLIVKVNYAQVGVSQAQANFIYNFTKFFDWPQSEKSGDFIIGVLGPKSMANELQKVTSGKKNVTQNIVVKHFKNIDEVTKSHVIFIGNLKADNIKNIHTKTGVHCLIISDNYSAIEKGAAIQFVTEGERLKYDFSKGNALKHGLKFHSKVADMARKTY